MKALVTALQEVYGLFVEDGSYAVAIIICLLIAAFVFPHIFPQNLCAPILFVALLLVLGENVLRSARKR